MKELIEARIITKVNAKGIKTKRVKCPVGFKLAPNKKSCVPMTGSEKAAKRLSIRKALKTKKAAGQALKVRTTRKRLRALKRRKSLGL